METPNTSPQWVTEKEVARITGLSLGTIRAHRFKRVGIPYSKIGKSIRYSLHEIEVFMTNCRIAPETKFSLPGSPH